MSSVFSRIHLMYFKLNAWYVSKLQCERVGGQIEKHHNNKTKQFHYGPSVCCREI